MTSLTSDACARHDMGFDEGLALLAISTTTDETYQRLVDKGLISKANGSIQSLNKKYHATETGVSVADELLSDSDEKIVAVEDTIPTLADRLREIYPTGKMPGTSYYYRCNRADIVRKLKSFFKRYGQYSEEQILEATKRYVESFNGNYSYLRLLKYFIWKDEVKDGEVLAVSQLADWIENKDSVNTSSADWTTTLI